MMQVLIELDAATAKRLEKAVPARSRKRSEFIRAAIRKALWEIEERATARAYAQKPDVEAPAFDPQLWQPRRRSSRK
jgi:Arc/MetJ-type ribon-helix-helix transcriptional regulator